VDLSEWVKSGMWLKRHSLLKREPDLVLEDREAGFWLEGWLVEPPALYRGPGGRLLSAQDLRNLKHLKLIAGGDGDGISS